jgi:hypothetical protein
VEGGRTVEGEFFRDSTVLAAEHPIQPNQSVTRVVGTRSQINLQCQFQAALFADGTTFGDPGWARRILQQRTYRAQSLRWVLADLTETGGLSTPTGVLLPNLTSSRDAKLQVAVDRDQRLAISTAYNWIMDMITRKAPSQSSALPTNAGQGMLATINYMLSRIGQ